jgi:serine/threonine protein kinase
MAQGRKLTAYNKEVLLGAGTFGIVHRVTEIATGEKYAMKEITP